MCDVPETHSTAMRHIVLLKASVEALAGAIAEQLIDLHSKVVDAALSVVEDSQNEGSRLEILCPTGLLAGYVYLSTSQDHDLKYWLLHKATRLLYSTPGLLERLKLDGWPVSDSLIRTLYLNSERVVKTSGLLPITEGFESVFLYNFYPLGADLCVCTNRSWCFPSWLGARMASMDVFIVQRGLFDRTVYFFDKRSLCFVSTFMDINLVILENVFSYKFVYDINSFMEPQNRIIQSIKTLLLPCFGLTNDQIANFNSLGVHVIPDDFIFKPPSMSFTSLLLNRTPTIKQQLIYIWQKCVLVRGSWNFCVRFGGKLCR